MLLPAASAAKCARGSAQHSARMAHGANADAAAGWFFFFLFRSVPASDPASDPIHRVARRVARRVDAGDLPAVARAFAPSEHLKRVQKRRQSRACVGSRPVGAAKKGPITHVALSHVSFGRAQEAPRALNLSWKGRPLTRPRHSGGDPGRTRTGPGLDPGRTRGGPGPDPVQLTCPRLCLRPLGACQIALPRVWEPSAAQCCTARCTVRALPG